MLVSLRGIAADDKALHNAFTGECITDDAWQAWYADVAARHITAGYVIEANGEPVGEAYLALKPPFPIKLIVTPAQRCRGIGTAAARLLTDEAFARSEVDHILLHAAPEHVGVCLRAGFAVVRMTGDQLEMRLTREVYEARRRESWLRDVYDAMCEHDANIPHNIHHLTKVHSFARQIGLHEGLDANTQFVLEVAALCHDIGIRPAREQTGACPGSLQEQMGPPIAEAMLTGLGLPAPAIRRVCFLIGHHHTTQGVAGIDWRILLEADFLVNMIEGQVNSEGIDAFRDQVFCTAEGLRLLSLIRPA